MADTDVDFPFPVLSPQATEEEKNLSLKEKLNLVDNEIRQLYEFCTKAGYTQPQIEQCAQPLLALQSREKHIKWFWRLFSLALVVAFVAFLFAYDPTYRRICIYGKSVAMKVKKSLFSLLFISNTWLNFTCYHAPRATRGQVGPRGGELFEAVLSRGEGGGASQN